MADEQHELRRINWTQVFSFTHIFKSFKMAIHPSKLVLALAAVVVVFILGTAMDWIWAGAGQYVREGEVDAHFAQDPQNFRDAQKRWKDNRLERAAMRLIEAESNKFDLNDYKARLPRGYLKKALDERIDKRNVGTRPPLPKLEDLKKGNDYQELLDEAREKFDHEIEWIEKNRSDVKESAGRAIDKAVLEIEGDQERKKQRKELKKQLRQHVQTAEQSVARLKADAALRHKEIQGEKIFASLLGYQRRCISNALGAVRYGNIFGGLQDYRSKRAVRAMPILTASITQLPDLPAPKPTADRAGFIYWSLLGVHGVLWLVSEHWLYAIIFLLSSLAVVAFFGGAIHRIAALHFAREEKISIVQAMRFSCGKFLSYFTAPLIPAAGILLLGLLLALGGLIGSIWVIGNILMGILFFLALIGGLIIAFLAVGLVGGAPLMYPTIAVEGSDSFDAISRSFSYVLSRPWRASFYGLVALVYGVITYVFVRLFVYLAMAGTHCFVKWGVVTGGETLHQEADKLDVMWPAPTFENLWGRANWEAMTDTMPVGAWLIGVWVFLLAAGVLAFLLSYAASSTTVIYYLLRRKVDATDLDDVYVEEAPEEELVPPAEQPEEEAPTEKGEPSESGGEEKTEE
jgi:hypothetical protein